MFGFGKKNKASVEVKTSKTGGPIKRLRVLIGAGVIIGVIHALEAGFGHDFLPAELEKETADLILNGVDLVIAFLAMRAMKPAVVEAANAQGSAVTVAKQAAGVKE